MGARSPRLRTGPHGGRSKIAGVFRTPRARTVATVAGASLVLGAAAWASRAVLDEVIVDGVRQRIALVPGWQTPLAFTLIGLLACGGLARALARSRRLGRPAADLGDLVLPLFGLVLLLLPFLPGLPDRWPMVQVLAGPAKWIVWAVVVGQCLWIALPHLAALRRWVGGRPPVVLTAAVWLATAAAAALGASRLTHTVLFPSGDEPHYLVIAQSLWRDGDLKIENNHTRGDYREYFNRPDLAPHFLRRGVDEEIYSVHPIGMPVMVAPVYAAGGYDGTVAFFIALGATAAAVAWRWVLTPDRGAGAGDAGLGGDRASPRPSSSTPSRSTRKCRRRWSWRGARPWPSARGPTRRAGTAGRWACWRRRCRG